MNDNINHPSHYQSITLEPIDICEAYRFPLGCAMKYLFRAGLKDGAPLEEDLAKAQWYLTRYLESSTGPAFPSTPVGERELFSAKVRLLIHDKPYLCALFGYEERQTLGRIDDEHVCALIARLDDTLEDD